MFDGPFFPFLLLVVVMVAAAIIRYGRKSPPLCQRCLGTGELVIPAGSGDSHVVDCPDCTPRKVP